MTATFPGKQKSCWPFTKRWKPISTGTKPPRDWEELEHVLFLLCEDNHGHLRTVPPRQMRNHPGGWGMYYHFDYHGGPVSYEWVDSTPLAQTWEAMTQAWDYGIREL